MGILTNDIIKIHTIHQYMFYSANEELQNTHTGCSSSFKT